MIRFALALLLSPALATAEEIMSDRLAGYEAGVICAVAPDRVEPAPGTVSGTKHVVEEAPPFVSTGRLVPAVIGVGFGVAAEAAAPGGIAGVTMFVTHPPFPGSGATVQRFPTSIPSGALGITFYQFDYDYELVPGTWTLTTVAEDGEILFSVPFEVVPPAALPELARACNYTDLLS